MASYTKALIDGKYKVNLEEELGRGSFSSVYSGIVSNTCEKVAVKKIQYKKKEQINREHFESCLKELEAFSRIQHHENIVKFLDHVKDDTSYWFVIEFCNYGDLQNYLEQNHVTFCPKVKIMIDCASAIKYVHSLKPPIVHRDIKLTNIMIMGNSTEVIAKIADFGIGKLFNKIGPETLHMHTMCVTSSFMAPEFFTQKTGKENPTYGPEVDTFALGLVLQVLLMYGKDPGMQYVCPLSVDVRDRGINPMYSYGMDMVHCKKENKPLPKLFHQCENDTSEESKVKQIITSMTEYESKDRMNLQDVVLNLTEIMFPNEVHKLIDIIDDGNQKKAVLNEATLKSLSLKKFANQDVVVISMMGMYRSGKSSLLNMWTGLGKKGFKTKGGEEACTSGVWIYCLQQQNKTIVLLDSQGTGDVFNTENDVWISLFSVLVCSVLVFNQPKNINDSLFRNLCTMVAHASSYSEVRNAPELCVLIRDYTLGPSGIKENSSLEKYLQDCIPEDRNMIKDFFKHRCCFIMGMPTAEPLSVDDWSFHNPNILKKYKDGAQLLWEYLTIETSTFKPAERTFSFKEWIDLVPSIVENMDLTLSVLKPEGEKLNMYLTADDRRRNAYKTQKKCFTDKVSRDDILTKSWELPCPAETSMHPITLSMDTDDYNKTLGEKYKLKFNDIGHGGFGIVYEGKNIKDGTLIAAKKVKYLNNEAVKNTCRKELEIFQKIKHNKNIVQLLDHIDDGDSYWFIMELCELGNLEDYLQTFSLVFTDKLKIMSECAVAICHLHTQNPAIVHRDIKLSNVMMQRDGQEITAKISDFGVCKRCYTNHEILQLETKTKCGTFSFMAPELFDNNVDLFPSIDIFSLGLLFQVLYLYDEGDRELQPLSVDSRRSNTLYHYGLEMKHAKEKDNPMPSLFFPCDSDPFYARRLQNTITSMTEYEAAKRMNIQTVKKTLQSILLSLRLWETGIRQLVEIQEDQSQKLKPKINQDTLQYLQSKISTEDRKVVVVSMIGLYRTGKSSLLNMWAGLGKKGFEWKDGEDSCTSGIWVYCLQQDDKDIILLDCQGTDDARSNDREIDVWISLFPMLTSSVLVFNKLHNIDQPMFDILYSMHAYANANVENFNYPELCLLIRDFTLSKITDTNDATLESHFTGSEDMTQEKVAIKKHFQKRKCFKLPIPSIEPNSVKEWSFGNEEIFQKFQDGSRQIWDYITQEASCFSKGEKALATKEWAMTISDIASCLDYIISDLRPCGEKVSISMTAEEIQWKLMRKLKERLVDEVNKVQMLKETFEEPINDIETCMLDEKQVNRQVDQLCNKAIEHLQKYTNGMDTSQLHDLKDCTKKVKENMKTVYSCLHKIFISLFSVRNSKNFCLLVQMSFPQLSQRTREKMAEFISCTAKCKDTEPSLSVIQTSGQEDETSEDHEERKLKFSSYLKSMKMDFMEQTYRECILTDDTVLENFLKDEKVDDVIIKDIMECFRSFFFSNNLSGLPRMLDAIENSDEWTPWMKDMILYNLQHVIKILTEQQFIAAGHVLKDIIQEANDNHRLYSRKLTRWAETQLIEPTWEKRIQLNLARMDKELKEQISCILQNFISKIISTPDDDDDIQTLLQKYFTASINSSNAKAMLTIIFELLKKYQRGNTNFWQGINLIFKTTLVILLMIMAFPLLVSRFLNKGNIEDGLTNYFKCVYEMSSKFYVHLDQWIYNSPNLHNSMPNLCKEFRIPYSFGEALSYIEEYRDNNFLPLQKLDPVMKLMHYILMEDFCKNKQKP